MPSKVVEIPGIGNVEFPDSMNDEQISEQIRKTTSSTRSSFSSLPAPLGPPIPRGLQNREPDPWKHPTEGLIGQGIRQVGAGIARMSQPGKTEKYAGVNEILGGVGKAALPFAVGASLPALAAAPLATAGGIASGVAGAAVGSIVGRRGARAINASPEGEELAGNLGGLSGGVVSSKFLPQTLKYLTKADPRVAVNRAVRPVPSNADFPEVLPQTLELIKAANARPTNSSNVFVGPTRPYRPSFKDGELDLIPAIQKTINVHQEALTPWLTRMEGTTISGDPIVRATQQAVSKMLPSEAGAGAALVQRARTDYQNFTPQQLRDRLALLNQRLSPFYNKSSAAQSSALADIPEAVLKAQRDAVAETLYSHLDPAGAGAGPRQIQSQTGNLIDLRDAVARRGNAIQAEQPLTNFDRFYDPVKNAIRHLMPFRHGGTGISYAEGSQGTSLPMLRKAFDATDEVAGANALGSLPRPISMPTNRQLPSGPITLPGVPSGPPSPFQVPRNPGYHTPQYGSQGVPRQLPSPPRVTPPPVDASGPLPNRPYPGSGMGIPTGTRNLPSPSQVQEPGFTAQGQAGSQEMVPVLNPLTGRVEYVPRYWRDALNQGH